MTEPRTPDDRSQRTEDEGLISDFRLPVSDRRPPAADLRSFWCLFVEQFQNAFSDNLLKWLVTYLIIGMGISPHERDRLLPLIGVLFSVPFILFSMAGGFLADKFSKRTVAVAIKCVELGIMTLALAGFWLNRIPLLFAAIFLMSTHSAFFGPTKYGLLPELLPEKKLSWGNGVFGLGTFVSIIAGTMAAGFLSDEFGRNQVWSGLILIGLAAFGLSFAVRIRRVPAADPQRQFRANFLGDFFSQLKAIRRDRVLFLGVVGNAFLWFLAALLQFTILIYGKDIFHFDDRQSSLLQGALLVGVGAGSLAAGFLSGGKIEYGLIPLGMFGLTVFAVLLSLAGFAVASFAWCLGFLGFFAGFYNVPVNAIIQHRPDPESKGKVIATGALLSWIGILLASGMYYLLTELMHLKAPQVFLAGAALSLAGTVYCVKLMPDSIIRLLFWFATKSIYRIRVEGRDHIPEKGGALFVCNHVSFVDAPLLQASTDRKIRFLMHRIYYDLWWVRPFRDMLGVIPIASDQGPREMLQSLHAAGDAVRDGHVVCIFAEGHLTRTGGLDEFHRGFERIMRGASAPIVPVALVGVWGSIFSFEGGKFFWKWPRQFPYHVTVRYGKPLPPATSPDEVRAAVEGLLGNSTTDKQG